MKLSICYTKLWNLYILCDSFWQFVW